MSKEGKARNGIYKRGSSWYVSIRINGTRIRRSAGSKQAAELILSELKKQRAIGKLSEDWTGVDEVASRRKSKTFAEAAAEYIAERPLMKPSTRRGYEEILNNYLLPEFGKLKLTQITEEQVVKFQAALIERLSAVRANNIVNLLRYILNVCVRRRLLKESPASHVPSLPEPPVSIDPLTTEELKLVIAKLHPHYRPLFITLAFTGARPNEMLALKWWDVDFERDQLHISKGRVRGAEGSPKTLSSNRTIAMLDIVRATLLDLRAKAFPGDYVFVTKKGKPIDKHVDRQWRVALKKAGLRHRPSYQLRHTFASYCLQQGCDPGWVASMLGHATLETTFKHYARYINNASRQNEAQLNRSTSDLSFGR